MRPFAAIALVALLSATAPVPSAIARTSRRPGRSGAVRAGTSSIADAGSRREVAGVGTAGAVEPAARHRTLGHRRGRRAAVHAVPRGNGRAKLGPWDAEEAVVALDAKTGQTIWEHKYPSRRQDFSFGAGPHSTPLVVGNRVFTIGTNQEMFAFDAATGKVLWSHDFIKEFNSPELLIRPECEDRLRLQPDRVPRHDHLQRRRARAVGDGVSSERRRRGVEERRFPDLGGRADPHRAGRPAAARVPRRRHRHGARSGRRPRALVAPARSRQRPELHDAALGTGRQARPLVGVSIRQPRDSVALRREQTTEVEELWFTNRVRFMFLSAIRVGDFVYGTTGDFGPAFLTALDIKTGQAAWQHRGFGRASLVQAGDKTIIMDEDGDLALARLTPQGATILTQARIFETTTWTAPSLVGTTLYARDREKIVALDLGAGGASTAPASTPAASPARRRAGRGAAMPAAYAPPPPPARFAGTWRLDAAASR